jgi:hypothetical protein
MIFTPDNTVEPYIQRTPASALKYNFCLTEDNRQSKLNRYSYLVMFSRRAKYTALRMKSITARRHVETHCANNNLLI